MLKYILMILGGVIFIAGYYFMQQNEGRGKTMMLRAFQLLSVERDIPRKAASSLSVLNSFASLARFMMSAAQNTGSLSFAIFFSFYV